jgi:hypothetical protein
MMRPKGNRETAARRAGMLAAIMLAVAGLTGCSHAMMMFGTGATRPAPAEFGLGPRASARNVYTATLEPSRELRPRQMQTVVVSIADRDGRPIEGATLTIGGGMPQHGHGLPTRPRVTRSIAAGKYEI